MIGIFECHGMIAALHKFETHRFPPARLGAIGRLHVAGRGDSHEYKGLCLSVADRPVDPGIEPALATGPDFLGHASIGLTAPVPLHPGQILGIGLATEDQARQSNQNPHDDLPDKRKSWRTTADLSLAPERLRV